MTDKDSNQTIAAALRRLEESPRLRQCATTSPTFPERRLFSARKLSRLRVFAPALLKSWLYARHWIGFVVRGLGLIARRRTTRRIAIGLGGAVTLSAVACLGLWWRLSAGPISLDLATPWLTAAIEENLGAGYRIEVGGTQLERDEQGRSALRIRDIVVRDSGGVLVASAPKAEVGFSGSSLLTGRLRAERLSLVGAEMALRIEHDGQLTLFAGADHRPIATAPSLDAPKV